MGSLAALRASRTNEVTSSVQYRILRGKVTNARTLKVRTPKCSLTASLTQNKSVHGAGARSDPSLPHRTRSQTSTEKGSPTSLSTKMMERKAKEDRTYVTSASEAKDQHITTWKWLLMGPIAMT